MSFRLRVALLTSLAVAIAAVGAAVLMYVVVRSQILDQVDQALVDAAQSIREPRGPRPGFPGAFPGARPGALSGRADVAAQILDSARGTVTRFDDQPVASLVTAEALAVAAGSAPAFFFESDVDGARLRVYVAPLVRGTAIEVWRPLDEVASTLAETRVRLGLVALASVLLAAALGAAVAQAALSPVRRLTSLVEEVAKTRDLTRRVSAGSRDELGRLAGGFNEMLGELEASLRSQRQLVTDASHELRTPLTSLRTNLELLARGQPTDPAERQEALDDVVGQLERLSTLVSDLIDLARDEEAPLTIEDVRLDEVAAEAIDAVRRRYPAVRFTLDAEPATLRGIRSRIMRAVTNLVDNAGKWSPAGAAVEVTVRGTEVLVRDHGPGVAPADEPRLFDRFWRAAAARQKPGSGLGLAIVKEIAEAHGGRATFERPADGGAAFRLSLGPAHAG